MDPSLTQLQVANRALTEIARGQPLAGGDVASNFDGTPSGMYVATVYQGAVQTLLRQQDYEFSRRVAALVTTGNTPPAPWSYEYTYPSDCIRVRQVMPQTWDANDPQPVRWEVGTAAVVGSQVVVIWTNQPSARLTYTSSAVTEGEWDDIFTETAVRYIGSMVALPVAGRPDFAREQLDTSGKLSGVGGDRDS